MERKAADGNKADHQQYCENGYICIEYLIQLDLQELPHQAEEPYECKYDCQSVQLVMDQPVMRVYLKNECVVDIVLSESLHCKPCGCKYKADQQSKVVNFDP